MAVHIINPLWNANGGSEWHAVSLFDLLDPITEVSLWSEEQPDSRLLGRYPIRRIGPDGFPKEGTLVFVGAYTGIGGWLRHTRPRRMVLIYNFFQPERLAEVRQALSGLPNLPPLEISFVSDYLRRHTSGVEGVVNPSPIDLSRFQPGRTGDPRFTLGRISRDTPEKHHPDDPALYRRLIAGGFRIRILGGTSLAEAMKDLPSHQVELLPEGAEPAEAFLQSIDVFYYRTHPSYQEAWGRVVLEAMATALPVVAGRHGGYADTISHGEDGYLVDDTATAEAVLRSLKADASTGNRMGAAARIKALETYSPQAMQAITAFYAH